MKKTRKNKQVCGATCFMAAEMKFSEEVCLSVRRCPSVVTRQKLPINVSVVLGADESPWPCGTPSWYTPLPLEWRHNGRNGISNHQPHDCFLNHLFRCRSKKTSKLSVTCLCAGNSPGTGEFPAQMASNAEYVSIWWRHHALNDSE